MASPRSRIGRAQWRNDYCRPYRLALSAATRRRKKSCPFFAAARGRAAKGSDLSDAERNALSAATRRRREMTLDCCFLSDSRNIFVQSRVISVHSWYLTSLVNLAFYELAARFGRCRWLMMLCEPSDVSAFEAFSFQIPTIFQSVADTLISTFEKGSVHGSAHPHPRFLAACAQLFSV